MREVGTFEAKNTLSALLDRVEEGEEIAITRHGKRVARLVKDTGDTDRQARSRKAAEEIVRLSRGLTLGGVSIRELIDEGRR